MKSIPLLYTESSKAKAKKLQRLLIEKACTVHEIAEHLACDRSTATKYIRYFRQEGNKKIYIKRYDKPKDAKKIQYPCPVYQWGKYPDAPRKPYKTNSERMKRYRRAIKAQPEKYKEYLRKKQLKRVAQKIIKSPPTIDPLLNSFFGMNK